MNEASKTFQVNNMIAAGGLKTLEALEKETKQPMETMMGLLMQILEDNKDTEYGKKYGFAEIHNYEEYVKRVPVIEYGDISGDVARMMEGEKDILTAYPCSHFNETSGAVGAPKAVPMTEQQQQVYMKYNSDLLFGLFEKFADPKWKNGRAFCTTSGGYCKVLPSGLTIGDASSRIAEYRKGANKAEESMTQSLFTSPAEGFVPKPGTDVKYVLTRFALMDRGVTGLITGFYSVAVLFFKYIADHYEMLIDDIEKGTIHPDVSMPIDVRTSLLGKIEPMPERAAELREIFKNGSKFPFVTKIWPDFCYISGVGADGFKVYDDLIREAFTGPGIRQFYSGITSSEGLWTVGFGADDPASVIAPGAAFIEFLPVEAENDFTQCKTLDQLEEGRVYELIVTNLSGLYRYRMSDAVKVVGRYNNTPTVEFMYRVNRTINLAAEKTTEKALQQTVENTMKDLGIRLSDYCVYPDTTVTPNRYVFLIESWEDLKVSDYPDRNEILYKHLCEANPVYRVNVEIEWLQKPVMFFTMPQSGILYRELMVMKGVSMNQVKPVRIISNEQEKQFFFSLLQPEDM